MELLQKIIRVKDTSNKNDYPIQRTVEVSNRLVRNVNQAYSELTDEQKTIAFKHLDFSHTKELTSKEYKQLMN